MGWALESMFDLKVIKGFYKKKNLNEFFIAGCDEVGRGPLAGPVVAACTSLHISNYDEKELKKIFKEWSLLGVNDSKKLKSEARRRILSNMPIQDPSEINQIYTHTYSKNVSLKILIKEIPPQTIDDINILNASLRAMREAAYKSTPKHVPGIILIDGNRTFQPQREQVELKTVIGGDALSLLIGLASIVAKEYRDNLMKSFAQKYPGYYWEQNAGYGTKKHLNAIAELGVTDIHRKTFRGVKEFYEERG